MEPARKPRRENKRRQCQRNRQHRRSHGSFEPCLERESTLSEDECDHDVEKEPATRDAPLEPNKVSEAHLGLHARCTRGPEAATAGISEADGRSPCSIVYLQVRVPGDGIEVRVVVQKVGALTNGQRGD